MSRGDYRARTAGCVGPGRSPILAWGLDAGVDEAKAGATRWALRPVMPAIDLAMRAEQARDGARGAYQAAMALGGRSGPTPAQVGGEWFHGALDRQKALQMVGAGLEALGNDLMNALADRRDLLHPTRPDPLQLHALDGDAQWIEADFIPVIKEWKDFVARETSSPLTLVATDWSAFEKWGERVKTLRQLARARGFVLTSPELEPLPRTIFEDGAAGAGGLASWVGMAKITIVTAMGLAGLYGLWSALRGRR